MPRPKYGESLQNDVEVLEVDDRDLGRIIGRGGTVLRELQQATHCKIEVPWEWTEGQGPQMRQISISGPRNQLARACDAVQGVLMGSSPKDALAEIDGAVVLRNVDTVSMAHLAKQQEALEQTHGVVLDLDAQSVHIWVGGVGSTMLDTKMQNVLLAAKDAVEAVLEQTTTLETVTVDVPAGIVNRVINDPALRQLKDQSGLTVDVAKGDKGSAVCLHGLAGVVDEARRLVTQLSTGGASDFVPLFPGLLARMGLCPQMQVDFRNDLEQLRVRSGAQVDLRDNDARAEIRGGQDAVAHAKREFRDILCFYFPRQCAVVSIPAEASDFVAGENGRELLRLQRTGAVVSLDWRDATVWLCGEEDSVAAAQTQLRRILDSFSRCFVRLTAPSQGRCWALIGRGGQRLWELRDETGADIDVDAESRLVTITGSEEAVDAAKRAVQRILQPDDWGGWENHSNAGWRGGSQKFAGEADDDDICWDFQKHGHCRRGASCSWRHT
eukprot:gnl/TRDRNA2_/TRDRNA2_158192_c0_seq2.p1 gnl/TRDRNA2_/TRDRNA2_158192_c0~~gnl/TRDRNA2_/TRDRNA2_158192_c0_seq2.p1  ORF type:complete len:497 (-),score=98.96 gnl/TRDRNA2_/TRDRNA2_158192_c0_seq2:8-1498(-)